MLGASKKCVSKNKKRTPWSPALGMATQTIRYWDRRIKRQGKRDPSDLVLNCYLMKSDVDKEAHECALSVQECIRQLNFSRKKLKDAVANAKEHRGQYEVQVVQAIVEKRNPGYKEGESLTQWKRKSWWKRKLRFAITGKRHKDCGERWAAKSGDTSNLTHSSEVS
jgi:hypothetical protein